MVEVPPIQGAAPMSAILLEAIQRRYACRRFVAGRPVAAGELAVLREAGRLAPSAFGLEPWRFITVEDGAGRAAVARACYDQPAAASAAAFIVIVALVAALDPDSGARPGHRADRRGLPCLLSRGIHRGLGARPVQLCRRTAAAAGIAPGPRQLSDWRIRHSGAGRRLADPAG